ncbi:hypothetical protein ACFFGT_00615 [Mucilaginibacter angelicae]|uniref:Uncharacterized protein n=1 Tax=Mucilaginibacter angelicae TaxID=869718 RepID=A0ABV6L071_9SPHI
MYHTITPVTSGHEPIIIEQESSAQMILFNAGPATIKAEIWTQWPGKINGKYPDNAYEANYNLELRAGNEKVISGAFVRVKLLESVNNQQFAAIGTRILPYFQSK